MPFQLELPDIGEGVVEAEVQKWFVAPGDHVDEDQPLVEVMTDKATVVIPSPRRGRVVRLFAKIARTRSYASEGDLTPDITRIRRAFFHMTRAAEDPGALRRLLDQTQGDARERARVEAAVEAVRARLESSWGACERIFRTAAAELLRLPRS